MIRCASRRFVALPGHLGTSTDRIRVFDLLGGPLSRNHLDEVDMILMGGSGHYWVSGEWEWLQRALDSLRLVHDVAKPTFASCWGFQAMARAMGGKVIRDMQRIELETRRLQLTEAGRQDPVFGPLGKTFRGQMGHEDCVEKLPPGTTLLASTDLVENQAFRFEGKPIYCTQFHPELNRDDLLERVRAYPEYVERTASLTMEQFIASCQDTPAAESLLPRFARLFLEGKE